MQLSKQLFACRSINISYVPHIVKNSVYIIRVFRYCYLQQVFEMQL